MTGYKVVPQALRDNVKFLQDAADAWEQAKRALDHQQFDDSDLGILGRASGATRYYNDALADVLDRLREGIDALENAGVQLKAVADEYESRDAEYYRRFGYMAR